jgi:membrane protease YdiL (CAAX protease family)
MEPGYKIINAYIEKSPILSFLKYSQLARTILSVFIQSYIILLSLFFYKRGIKKAYISKIRITDTLDMRGKWLFIATVLSTIIYIIIGSAYFSPQKFPPFDLKNMLFWIPHIFIICFLAPSGEEIFFRGIVLNEMKYCYNISPRLIIFLQALLFFLIHFLFSSSFPLVIFMLGLVTGVFAFYTDSLLYSLIFHVCYNLFILLRQTGVINLSEYKISYYYIFLLILLFFTLNILFILFFIKHMKTKSLPCNK